MNLLQRTVLLAFGSVLLLAAQAIAQIPRTISYQGVLATPGGQLLEGAHTVEIRLYESLTASTPVYSEATSNVVVIRGIFNLMIGSTTPIPTTLSFDRAYFIGVSVDGGAELTPRIPISPAPYALYAETAGVAKSLAPGAAGVVTSVNGMEGALRIRGAGSTTVNRSGDTIVISSSGGAGGNGIQGVQSPGNTINVGNASGPVADLDLADGGVTATKLANNAVTSAKIQDGAVGTTKLQDSAITTAKLRNASVTQEKIAPGVSFPPGGNAGGDLSGSYPNPAIATGAVLTAHIKDSAVTTAKLLDGSVTDTKLANDAVTSAKIADGTIIGTDINTNASLIINTLNTTGTVGVGVPTATSRMSIRGAGSTLASASLDIVNSVARPLLYVRDDGNVGIGTTAPTAALDIVGGPGVALRISSGALVAFAVTIPAAAVIAVPPNISILRIADDGLNVPIVANLPPGAAGQIILISNDDAVNTVGVPAALTPITPGQTRLFIHNGAGWRLVT